MSLKPITTEKDYYRMNEFQKEMCEYIKVDLEIQNEEYFKSLIKKFMKIIKYLLEFIFIIIFFFIFKIIGYKIASSLGDIIGKLVLFLDQTKRYLKIFKILVLVMMKKIERY